MSNNKHVAFEQATIANGRRGPMLGVLLVVALITYFSYHALQGELGLLTFARLNKKIAAIEPRLEVLKERRRTLENRVSLLKPDHMDADMLEERARVLLNYGYHNERIVLLQRPVIEEVLNIRPVPAAQTADHPRIN